MTTLASCCRRSRFTAFSSDAGLPVGFRGSAAATGWSVTASLGAGAKTGGA